MSIVKLVNIKRNLTDKQVYMQSFCESWIAGGGAYIPASDITKNKLKKNLLKAFALSGLGIRKNKCDEAYLICSRGQHLLKSSLPFCFKGEIIPMLWDCWEYTWKDLERDLRLLNVKICFMTASAAVRHFSELMPDIRFYHIPEGVDVKDYQQGKELHDRSIDVYEIGRKYPAYHQKLIDGELAKRHKFIYLNKKPDGKTFIFETFDAYLAAVRDSKITVSFPASVTDPINASVETLSMRYWESLLSKCIIVGHCPRELSDLLGYNPVIEADMKEPVKQIDDILGNIGEWQPFVDKNYEAALRHASWDGRIKHIFKILNQEGYICKTAEQDTNGID